MKTRRIEIVVPARDEERYIAATVRSLLPLRSWPFAWHLTVVDGCSSDSTTSIALTIDADGISVTSNPMILQSAGVNMLAMSLPHDVDVVVRADAHCLYPPDFAATVTETLERTGADSVVVGMVSKAWHGTAFGRATAAAQNSRLGNGGSAHRNGGRSGFVDHGHHAAFRRDVFVALGGYDESFTHNEDAEFDMRMTKAGRRIYLDGDAQVLYLVRETPSALARQYFNHGAGRARTVLKHRAIRLRQVAPAAITTVNAVAVAISPFCPVFLAVPATYAACCIGFGAANGAARGVERLAGFPAMIMHHAWGAGFLSAMVRAMMLRGPFQFLGAFAQRTG
jgi:succinoglycan biosynthesis protein ExoA